MRRSARYIHCMATDRQFARPGSRPPRWSDSLAMDNSLARLMPMVGVVFIAFLMIGMAMPVLPLHVHHGLGFGTFLVGLVAGSQFAASVVSRVWAGRHSDLRGPTHAVVTG